MPIVALWIIPRAPLPQRLPQGLASPPSGPEACPLPGRTLKTRGPLGPLCSHLKQVTQLFLGPIFGGNHIVEFPGAFHFL